MPDAPEGVCGSLLAARPSLRRLGRRLRHLRLTGLGLLLVAVLVGVEHQDGRLGGLGRRGRCGRRARACADAGGAAWGLRGRVAFASGRNGAEADVADRASAPRVEHVSKASAGAVADGVAAYRPAWRVLVDHVDLRLGLVEQVCERVVLLRLRHVDPLLHGGVHVGRRGVADWGDIVCRLVLVVRVDGPVALVDGRDLGALLGLLVRLPVGRELRVLVVLGELDVLGRLEVVALDVPAHECGHRDHRLGGVGWRREVEEGMARTDVVPRGAHVEVAGVAVVREDLEEGTRGVLL